LPEDRGGLTPSLGLAKGACKKKAPYFGPFQGIILTSLNKFGVSGRKYAFKICKKIMCRKQGLPAEPRGSIHPGLPEGVLYIVLPSF